MTTALAVVTPRLTQDALQMIMSVAPTLHEARLFGTKSAQQAAAIMIKGYELGFGLTASFEFVHIIDEKPSLSPRGALALIYASPELAGIKITDEVDSNGVPIACTVWLKRKNGFEYTARFSMEDAKRAGLVKSGSGWEKYPANMLKYRALGYCQDIVFPDVIGGTKRADEFGADLTPDGDVIDGSWTNVGSQPSTPVAQPTVSQNQASARDNRVGTTVTFAPVHDPSGRLMTLVEQYGAAAIMDANGGKIPGTIEEVNTVELILGIAK